MGHREQRAADGQREAPAGRVAVGEVAVFVAEHRLEGADEEAVEDAEAEHQAPFRRPPKLAAQADKYVVLRNITHTNGVHGPGQQYMRTGNRPLPTVQYPDHGAVVSKELAVPKGIPPYVTMPIRQSNGLVEQSGYLGVAYRSFSVPGDPNSPSFTVRALSAATSTPNAEKTWANSAAI